MFGAWGNATASRDGNLLQLRALDWDTDGPFKNHHVLVRLVATQDHQCNYEPIEQLQFQTIVVTAGGLPRRGRQDVRKLVRKFGLLWFHRNYHWHVC